MERGPFVLAAVPCSADRLRRWRDQHHHPGDQHPVHQHQRRGQAQLTHRLTHGLKRGLQDVDLVDHRF